MLTVTLHIAPKFCCIVWMTTRNHLYVVGATDIGKGLCIESYFCLLILYPTLLSCVCETSSEWFTAAVISQTTLSTVLQYVFRPPEVAKGSTQRTVHEELAKQLTNILRPAQTDPQLVNSFLSHAAFFFDVLLKSMTLFLIDTERIKVELFVFVVFYT